MSLRIVFAGTPEFAVPALQAVLDLGHRPVLVMTQPDRPKGRGQVRLAPPVKALAIKHDLEVWQPTSLKGERLAQWAPDVMITAAYGLLIPPAMLAEPRLGCWNLHASLLPRWRGASPIQQAILAGDIKTGISLMQMDKGLDTGPVFMQSETQIGPRETAAALHDRLAKLAADLLKDALGLVVSGALPAPTPQSIEGVTHAPLIKKSDAKLDWSLPARQLDRMVRAYDPWPVAHTDVFADLGEPMCRIWAAQPGPSVSLPPGALVRGHSDAVVVACGEGTLQISELQAAGRRRLSAREWLNAHPDWR